MRKEEFLGLFIGFIIKKSDQWLPEEDTEENMLNTMQFELYNHNEILKSILNKYNGKDE